MLKRNVGDIERIFRALGALSFVLAALLAPLPLPARGVGLGLGAYLMFTALAGTCLGYRLMGRLTCPLQAP
jgi:hypothetical protein